MAISQSEQEKLELEHEAARLFMRAYENLTGREIRHLWHNRPNKPDASCLLEGDRLDLEIAHLYGSEVEAMTLLGRDASEQTLQALRELDTTSSSHERLLSALNRILENKAKKRYQSERVWLVIRNMHHEWKAHDIEKAKHAIHVPNDHMFESIWLVGDEKAQSGIVQLF